MKKRYAVKRVAIIGCGSIGQRHISNLRRLGVSDIVALRSRRGHFQELDSVLGVREVYDWDELIAAAPDAAIISNPTSLHPETISRLTPHVRGIFIEKPLADSIEGVKKLLENIQAHRISSFVGYNLQFHPVVQKIRELFENGDMGAPLVLQCQVGQWLPSWHPYEDYRKGYYARKDLGGGVALTMIHEVHLAIELLGPARRVACLLPDTDLLDLDVDSIADFMVQHSSGATSQIHLDYIQLPVHRCGVISFERGWVSYDLISPRVVVQYAKDQTAHVLWENSDYDANRSYFDEMQMFLSYVEEGRMRHDFDAWSAARSLAVVDAALKSAGSGRLIELPQ